MAGIETLKPRKFTRQQLLYQRKSEEEIKIELEYFLKSSSATKEIKDRVALSSDAAQNRFNVKVTRSHRYKLSHAPWAEQLYQRKSE